MATHASNIWDRMIWIDPADRFIPIYTMQGGECVLGGATLGSTARLIVHELGHAYDTNRRFGRVRMIYTSLRRSEYSAMRRENAWARRNNQPERCRYGNDF